jgi:hypothetical protein
VSFVSAVQPKRCAASSMRASLSRPWAQPALAHQVVEVECLGLERAVLRILRGLGANAPAGVGGSNESVPQLGDHGHARRAVLARALQGGEGGVRVDLAGSQQLGRGLGVDHLRRAPVDAQRAGLREERVLAFGAEDRAVLDAGRGEHA